MQPPNMFRYDLEARLSLALCWRLSALLLPDSYVYEILLLKYIAVAEILQYPQKCPTLRVLHYSAECKNRNKKKKQMLY